MTQRREELLEQIWKAQDEAYDLMCEYDALPHHYGEDVLYQAEGELVSLIGAYPDTTITDLALLLKKTPSACSQIVRKLKEKGLVEQIRNPKNNRQFKLQLTGDGHKVYQANAEFNRACQKETFRLLEDFADEELAAHARVQERLNWAYAVDVRRSREKFKDKK